ncbi:hypothetical protein [Acidianus manzaensis]|uniref:Uncharacterized protein n=1 Tax=Acidianus manzaensis TaxID=282676 RepID=A0A1W6JZA0_9CREN|nr:hypothetical protein [Acidianus manzaensis]ARM75562.1 hypothetical protein B6F84_05605 [Acidianus manzaensis]
MNKVIVYISAVLVIIGIILMIAGTRTVTFAEEHFAINGMYETEGSTTNYFWNFFGLAIFLFGIGGFLSYFELNKGINNKKGGING